MANQEMYSDSFKELLDSTISVIERAEREITLNEEYKDLVFILGDTALDVSFIQLITGDFTNTKITEAKKSSGQFTSEENGEFVEFALKYQNASFELVSEGKPTIFYYGWFSEARSTSVDIANTYITNTVLSRAERIKIIFVLNYSSLERGVERGAFMKFLKHASSFVEDIEKYRESVAMVAIRDNQHNLRNDESSLLVGDISLIQVIANFVLEMRQYIADKQKDPATLAEDAAFYENALKLTDIILQKEGGRYKKIGIFRKIDEQDIITNITALQVERDNMKNILCDELSFTDKLDLNFRISISEKSESDINNLVEELNNAVWYSAKRIAGILQEYYKKQEQKLLGNLEFCATGKTIVDADPVEAVSLKFKKESNTISFMVDELQKSLTIKELLKKIKHSASTLDMNALHFEIQSIEKSAKYINVLEDVSKKEVSKREMKAWGVLFKDLEEYISESTKIIQNKIDGAAEMVKHRIQVNLGNTGKKLRKNYNEKLKNKLFGETLKFRKLQDAFDKEYENIFKMTEKIKLFKTIDSLVQELKANASILEVVSPQKYITNIINDGKCFMFLHFLSEKGLDYGTPTWSKEFEEVNDFLRESEKWYRFLSDLYLKLSEYGTQIQRKNYIDFLERSRDSGIFHETNITPINFEIFLRKIRDLNVAEYENIRNIPLTESRLNELNQLVDFTLKHTITVQCSDTHMLVKGTFVSVQEINLILSSYYNQDCNVFNNSKNHRKYINIFALNTIFIDEDLDLQGKKMQLIYISPRWEVIGNRVINLNGNNGPMLSQTKASDCSVLGGDGDHGKPGEPGGSGGIFFGIGGVFVNGANLTITANGGDGGPGQDGGNGCEGIPGHDVTLPGQKSGYYLPGYYEPKCCYTDNAFWNWIYPDVGTMKHYKEELSEIKLETRNGFGCKINFRVNPLKYINSRGPFHHYITFRTDFDLFGQPGWKGGDGGNGGKGGIGGNSGSVKIIEINETSEINAITSNGKDGDIGRGGLGGRGGKDGNDAIASCYSVESDCFFCIFSTHWTERWVLDKRIIHNRRSQSGKNGRSGTNSENIKDPEPPLHTGELLKIINEYKKFLRENLTDDLNKNCLKTFHEQISKNSAVRNVYDTTGLVAEFTDLEDQYYSLNKEVDFSPFYKNLLERIGEYSECPENCDTSRDDKIVRSYLYAAVLSKINSLKESTETDLIIDIEKYFDTIKTEIDLLQDLGNVNSKVKAVDEMKKEYKYRIDKKIEEAKYFIEYTVNPEINKISRHIDNKVDSLIDEIISLQNKTQIEKSDFENKKEELKDTLTLKKVFDLVKGWGRFISYLVPYGSVINDSIELYTSVGEYFTLDNNEEPIDLSNAASKLNAIENNIKLMRIQKTEYLNNVLNELSEEITQYPEELCGISSKVTDMKNRLSDIRIHDLPYNEFRELEYELKDTLRTKETDLESQTTEKSPYVIEMLTNFIKVIEVGSMFAETYDKIKGKDEKIDAIDEAIQQKENELILLREYEEQIYELLRPAFKNIKDSLQVFAQESNKVSQVAFDVSKWKMHSTLKDITIQMQRITEEFQVKPDFSHCLEKLQEAISLLITIYDRIQQYQDEQILSNHIANVCSITPWTLSESDQNLVNIASYLEFSIRSSLVLKNYQTALNAFKQWVFPFSSHYLEGSLFSSGLKPDGNIRNLVLNAAKEIQILKRKISLYKASAKETDETLIRGEFNCRCISCEPFYVWKNEQYRNEISRLLSGETVALKADVHHSEPGKDAIKFKSIKLHFKSKNETIQTRLDETLKMFDVSLTHIGNSYYRYDDEIYLITSPKRSIIYSFEESARTGNPVRENEVYIKIREGNLMLSPYTMWILKLNATKRSSFRELNIYKGEVDLELEGKGSYVINNFGHEDAIDSQLESSDLNYRTARSLVRQKRTKRFASNGSASSLSSPINTICNFFKLYATSLITISFNKLLNYGSRTLEIEETINSLPKSPEKSVQKFSNAIKGSDTLNRELRGKPIDAIDENDPTLKDPDLKGINMLWEYSIAKNLDTTIKRSDVNGQVKPFMLNEQESQYYDKSIQLPDLNYSLLFADFIARSLTGIKYETGMDESLMSPKQVIFKKCDESSIKNENDIIKNFRLFSEMDENNDRSWSSSVKCCIKSIFKSFGFQSKEETVEYIRDVKHLFD